MRYALKFILPLLAIFSTVGLTSSANAAKYGVQDEGHFFSAGVVTQAQDVIDKIRTADNRDVLVMTYEKIPDDLKDKYDPADKAKFFADWAEKIGVQNGVSGVVILLTRDPKHLEVVVGNKTRQRMFKEGDRNELVSKMLPLLKEEKYDDALLAGVKFIKSRMDENERQSGAVQGSGQFPPVFPTQHSLGTGGFHVGSLLCVGIGILLIVFLIIGAVSRNRGGYGGGGAAPGGYPPSYGGGYPQGGGYGGGFQAGRGGGFGTGLLGGLLGGALGSWGYDRFARPGSGAPGYTPPSGGGAGGDFGPPADQTDTSFSGGGADFGSSGDSGGGSGGDFGGGDTGGGGGDSGGGGGDF